MKAETLTKTRHNPIVRSMLATNINNVLSETHSVVLNSDAPDGMQWEVWAWFKAG